MAGATTSRYAGRRVTLYFPSPDRLDEYRQLADAEGYRNKLSTWFLEKIELAATGDLVPAGRMEELQEAAQKARQDYEHERDVADQYRRELQEARAELAEAREQITEYAEQFARIAHHLDGKR